MKAIVSSKMLYQYLPYGTRNLKLEKDKMILSNEYGLQLMSYDVHTLGDGSKEIELSDKQIVSLINILRQIPEQPITIYIDDSNFGLSMVL